MVMSCVIVQLSQLEYKSSYGYILDCVIVSWVHWNLTWSVKP